MVKKKDCPEKKFSEQLMIWIAAKLVNRAKVDRASLNVGELTIDIAVMISSMSAHGRRVILGD